MKKPPSGLPPGLPSAHPFLPSPTSMSCPHNNTDRCIRMIVHLYTKPYLYPQPDNQIYMTIFWDFLVVQWQKVGDGLLFRYPTHTDLYVCIYIDLYIHICPNMNNRERIQKVRLAGKELWRVGDWGKGRLWCIPIFFFSLLLFCCLNGLLYLNHG